jgi:hypothetical protein
VLLIGFECAQVDEMLDRLAATEAELAEQVNRTNSALDEFDKANTELTAVQMQVAVAQEQARAAETRLGEMEETLVTMRSRTDTLQAALEESESKLETIAQVSGHDVVMLIVPVVLRNEWPASMGVSYCPQVYGLGAQVFALRHWMDVLSANQSRARGRQWIA